MADEECFSTLPELCQVAEVQRRVLRIVTEEMHEHTRSLFTSLGPEQAARSGCWP